MILKKKLAEITANLRKFLPDSECAFSYGEIVVRWKKGDKLGFYGAPVSFFQDNLFLELADFPNNCGVGVLTNFPVKEADALTDEQRHAVRKTAIELGKLCAWGQRNSLVMATLAQHPKNKNGQITKWADVLKECGFQLHFRGKNRNSSNTIEVYSCNLLEQK